MLNKAIYLKDPIENRLANNGVAKVTEDHSDVALKVLCQELSTFVCDGQYVSVQATHLQRSLVKRDDGVHPAMR